MLVPNVHSFVCLLHTLWWCKANLSTSKSVNVCLNAQQFYTHEHHTHWITMSISLHSTSSLSFVCSRVANRTLPSDWFCVASLRAAHASKRTHAPEFINWKTCNFYRDLVCKYLCGCRVHCTAEHHISLMLWLKSCKQGKGGRGGASCMLPESFFVCWLLLLRCRCRRRRRIAMGGGEFLCFF